MTEPISFCGLCGAHSCEVDELVQLGRMGHVCLCCLEQVANEKLPGPVTQSPGIVHARVLASRPVAMDFGEKPERGKVIPLRPRGSRTE